MNGQSAISYDAFRPHPSISQSPSTITNPSKKSICLQLMDGSRLKHGWGFNQNWQGPISAFNELSVRGNVDRRSFTPKDRGRASLFESFASLYLIRVISRRHSKRCIFPTLSIAYIISRIQNLALKRRLITHSRLDRTSHIGS